MENTLAKIIIESREKEKLSQRELARRIDIDNAYISRIEKGEIKKPSIIILMKLSKELKINFINLLFMTYTSDEINAIGVFNNINDVFNFVDDETIEKVTIIDENDNKRISIVKMLEKYKKNEIDTNKFLGLLSCITNKNFYDYLTQEEMEKLEENN